MPSATSASRKSVAPRGCRSSRAAIVSASRGPVARCVNSPSSTALRSVLEPQKAKPSCRIGSGVTCSSIPTPCATTLSIFFRRRWSARESDERGELDGRYAELGHTEDIGVVGMTSLAEVSLRGECRDEALVADLIERVGEHDPAGKVRGPFVITGCCGLIGERMRGSHIGAPGVVAGGNRPVVVRIFGKELSAVHVHDTGVIAGFGRRVQLMDAEFA